MGEISESTEPFHTIVVAPSFQYFSTWNVTDNPGKRLNPNNPHVTILTRPHDEYRLRGMRHTPETPIRVIFLNTPAGGPYWDRGGVIVGLRRAGVTEVEGETGSVRRLY